VINNANPFPGDRVELTLDVSSYQTLKLEPRKSGMESASLKIRADALKTVPLSADKQAMRPFKPGVWTWDIEPLSTGEHTAYLSIEAKRADGTVISSLIPIRIEVSQNLVRSSRKFAISNWQWIAGTLVIPLATFVWGRISGKNSNSVPTTKGASSVRRPRGKGWLG
jgi:hypothetical protein